jgi:hypothetical protein
LQQATDRGRSGVRRHAANDDNATVSSSSTIRNVNHDSSSYSYTDAKSSNNDLQSPPPEANEELMQATMTCKVLVVGNAKCGKTR